MRIIYLFILILLSPFSGFAQHETYSPKDMSELHNLVTKWDRYWNLHNMDSTGTLMRENVDFVNVAGQWLKGKKEAVAVHKERHQVVFKNSVFKSDSIHIKYVKPDLAIMHIHWGITGDVDPDGKPRPPRQGIFTWVATKEKDQWLLLAVHNVNTRETGAFMNPPEKN